MMMAALLEVLHRFETNSNVARSNRATLPEGGEKIIGPQEGFGVDPASSISILQEATSLTL